jgi:hypothetical protein
MRLDQTVSWGEAAPSGALSDGPSQALPPEPSVDLQVDEGLLIVGSAFRLSLKNLLIVRALRDGADYDEGVLVGALRAQIDELVAEKEDEGARLESALSRARRRRGWASWHDDYRQQDVPVLERRAEINRRLVERLHALSADSAFLHAELAGAREAALDEIVQARLAPVTAAGMDEAYPAERERRLALLRQDIEQLIRNRR